ncbi:MAG: hypothetical protein AB8B50_05790 [Pirellulaceae bacterium]
MVEILQQPTVQAVLSIAVVLALIYAAIVIVGRLRPSTIKADTSVEDLAANFEEMRLEGDIDDAELRKIKSVLGKTKSDSTLAD